MMSLVAYDSEISDSEEEHDSTESKVIQFCDNIVNTNLISSQVDGQELFKALPLPKKAVLKSKFAEDVEDEFLKKKEIPVEFPKKFIETQKASERKPAKIFLPSLSSFEDEKDHTPVTKFQPSVKGTGLLSLLPQPKAAQVSEQIKKKSRATLIPDAVKKKSMATSSSKVTLENKLFKKKLSLIKYESSDESDPEENAAGNSVDFFSLKKSPSRELLNDNSIIGNTSNTTEMADSTPHSIQSNDHDDFLGNEHETPQVSYYHVAPTENVSQTSTMDIDDEVLRKLCGSRARHKGENMQIIDINQKEMLPDPKEWLTKALTEDNSKRTSSSKRRGDEPTTQQRRKHQITYLAHQAKANEQELQNQWSNNRLSKKQTQSKYGF